MNFTYKILEKRDRGYAVGGKLSNLIKINNDIDIINYDIIIKQYNNLIINKN